MQQRFSSTSHVPGRSIWLLMVVLSITALVISGYLTFQSLVTGSQPLGCGAGSGCAEVLASKWARWLGLPVSGLATLVYLVTAITLFALPCGNASRQPAGAASMVPAR